MTTALTPLAAVAKLATTAARYITATPAPETVAITLYPKVNRIDIQPGVSSDSVQVLGGLLIWTHSLTGISGTWWHTNSGNLHITLTGRGPHGITVRVYDSFPYRHAAAHVPLAAGEKDSVTPDELYRLALELRKDTTR
jgi:hypothetical protein